MAIGGMLKTAMEIIILHLAEYLIVKNPFAIFRNKTPHCEANYN